MLRRYILLNKNLPSSLIFFFVVGKLLLSLSVDNFFFKTSFDGVNFYRTF